jgi:hypothetical protein
MRTLRQIQAARANGKHSKGPITAEGKATVAKNAVKHGLTAGTVLLQNENEDRFQAIYQSLCERFQPEDEAEHLCVEEMAWAKWRLRRALTYETALLQQELAATTEATHQATKSANAWAKLHLESPGFRNLARYETIHRRAYTRALEELYFLQNTKLQNKPDAPQTGEEEIAA